MTGQPGQIVILNGAPRSGKSSIVAVIQETFEGVWINLGVDVSIMGMTPKRFRPGAGLRPGGERPDLEPLVQQLYGALFESIAAHSRSGLNVVADFGMHEDYSQPLGILQDCARRLNGLPVLFVGVDCDLDEIMRRRRGPAGHDMTYVSAEEGEAVPAPVLRWQEAVHGGWEYDLRVDTTAASPEACAAEIGALLGEGNAGGALALLVER